MKVAVLGAGYAGLMLARRLERSLPSDVDLVVVNDRPDHLVQHELHRVVRRPALADRITVDLDDVLDRAEVRIASVTEVDHDAGVAHLEDEMGETKLDYDVGAVCLGAETAYYGLPGIEEHSTPLKRLPDAARIRERFLELGTGDRAVVGGAGLSGIQVAGELAALADEEALGCEVVLLEQADAVAPNFDAAFQDAVHEELESCGVVVKTGQTVERATETAIEFEDRDDLDYDQLVWTGGLRGPDALGGERPMVPDNLELGERTFAVGDAARVTDTDGAAVPASAAAAVREALTVAKSITRIVDDDRDGVFEPRPERFRFDAPGWLVSVGDGAVGQVGPRVVRGATANAMKSTVGATYLSVVGAPGNAVGLLRDEP